MSKPVDRDTYVAKLKDVILALKYHGEDLKKNEQYRKHWMARKDECVDDEVINSFNAEDRKWIEEQIKEFVDRLKKEKHDSH